MRLPALAMLAILSLDLAHAATAGKVGSPPAPAAEKGPLSGLPSAPGPNIEKIKSMGDNAWLKLGSPAADPKWGKARGRAWCPHMSYAPELKAAFFTGEGVHAWYNKENNKYMDDLWAYDVNAHRWICVYPGSDIKTLSLKMDANGFEVDSDGQPIPVAQLVHAYEHVTYDTDRKKFMFMPSPSDFWLSIFGERRKEWGGGYPRPWCPLNCSPWMYNPAANKYEILKVQGAYPTPTTAACCDDLVYVPSLKKLFFYRSETKDAWLYDPQANTWTNLKPKGPPPPFGIDACACLDPKRERIYIGGGYYPVAPGNNAFWCYDIKSNAWVDLQPKGKVCGGSNRFGPAEATVNYDSANDVVVLLFHYAEQKPEDRGVYIYDPASNSWNETALNVPKEVALAAGLYALSSSGFYSPELNAHFFYAALDSDDNGTMWAYRYKMAKK